MQLCFLSFWMVRSQKYNLQWSTIANCNFCNFRHVHEKAILLVVLPMSIVVFLDRREAELFTLLSATANVSLFPLLFQREESLIKLLLSLTFTLGYIRWYQNFFTNKESFLKSAPKIEVILLLGLWIPVLSDFILPLLSQFSKFQFLNLLIYSVYCSVCLMYCFCRVQMGIFDRKGMPTKLKRG